MRGQHRAHRTQYAGLKALVAYLAALLSGVPEGWQALNAGFVLGVGIEGIEGVLPVPAQLRVVTNLLVEGQLEHQARWGGVERLDQGDERQLHALGQVRDRGGVARPLTLYWGNRRYAILGFLSWRILLALLHK